MSALIQREYITKVDSTVSSFACSTFMWIMFPILASYYGSPHNSKTWLIM